ncbi:Lrp/AsnC family transcriptional regulator [Microbacterium sediminicola]
MTALDPQDLDLISALARDGRATVVSLSEELGLSRNTVQTRMAKLERAGALPAYERALSPRTLGFPIEAYLAVTVHQQQLPGITESLLTIPEIVQVHGLSGPVDLLVRVACRDAAHLFEVDARILSVEGVERTETSIVMGEVIGYRTRPLMELARSDR